MLLTLSVGAYVLLCPAGLCYAELIQLGPWRGAVEASVDLLRQETESSNSPLTSFDSTHVEERVSLRNEGASLYDPRFLTMSIGGTFGLSQERLDNTSSKTSRKGEIFDYDALVSVLPDQATSLSLFANRSESSLAGGLVGRNDIVTENRGTKLSLRRLYIPSTLALWQEIQEEETRTDGLVSRRADTRNIFRYEGQRGWFNSEINMWYEFVDLSAEVLADLSFKSHEGSVEYGLDFGTELNRHWDSRFRFFDRAGSTDLSTLTLDESLRVDHTDRLSSEYRYFLTRTDTTGGATTTHTGTASLHHQLYDSLGTTLWGDTIIQKLPGGDKNAFRGRLDFDYVKRIPGSGRLIGNLGGSLQYEDDRFGDSEGFVAQETHVFAIPFALPTALDNPLVVTSSVVVTKIAVGELPFGCVASTGPPTPLVVGRDFTFRTVGGATEIVPVACSGSIPGINPGDTIAVDYRFGASQSITFSTATWRTNITLDYRWIRPYFSHEQTDEDLLSGFDGQFIEDRQSDIFGTELRFERQRFWVSFVGETQRFNSLNVAYDTFRSTQLLGFRILPELTLTFSSDQAWSDFSKPKRRNRSSTGRAVISYALSPYLFSEVFVGRRVLNDTVASSERLTEAGLRIQKTFRMMDVNSTMEWLDRTRGDSNLREFRALLRLTRRF